MGQKCKNAYFLEKLVETIGFLELLCIFVYTDMEEKKKSYTKDKTVNVIIRISPELKERLKLLADSNGMTISEHYRKLAKESLEAAGIK